MSRLLLLLILAILLLLISPGFGKSDGMLALLQMNITELWKRANKEVYAVVSDKNGNFRRYEIPERQEMYYCAYSPLLWKYAQDVDIIASAGKLGYWFPEKGSPYDNSVLVELAKQSRKLISGSIKLEYRNINFNKPVAIVKYNNDKMLLSWKSTTSMVYMWIKCVLKESQCDIGSTLRDLSTGKGAEHPLLIKKRNGDEEVSNLGQDQVQDVRIFSLTNGSLIANWCMDVRAGISRFITFHISDLLVEGGDDIAAEKVFVASPTTRVDLTHHKKAEHQKNWPVFQYKSNVFYIASILPFHVVSPITVISKKHEELLEKRGISHSFGRSVSMSTSQYRTGTKYDYCWPWGRPRGGTPAIVIDGEYWGIFFSKVHLSSFDLPAYVLGIYTFTSKPPFKLTSMSRQPIVVEKFLDISRDFQTDLKQFPVSLEVDKESDRLFISMGVNNREAWVVELILSALKPTLRPFNSDVYAACRWDNDQPILESFEYLETKTRHMSLNNWNYIPNNIEPPPFS